MSHRRDAVIERTKPGSDARMIGVLAAELRYAPRFEDVKGPIMRQFRIEWTEERHEAALFELVPILWPDYTKPVELPSLFGGTVPPQ